MKYMIQVIVPLKNYTEHPIKTFKRTERGWIAICQGGVLWEDINAAYIQCEKWNTLYEDGTTYEILEINQ